VTTVAASGDAANGKHIVVAFGRRTPATHHQRPRRKTSQRKSTRPVITIPAESDDRPDPW
jgi:hypothetical protein